MPAKISKISDNSPFVKSGVTAGDLLVSINSNPINDFLEYYYYSAEPQKKNKYTFQKNNGKQIDCVISCNDTFEAGLELEDFKVLRCGNKCVFCFCDQHPKTARSALFFKDEDYRLSFLYGNYITLSNLKSAHYSKITDLKLSPLYISVHSTDDTIRRKMLGINYKFNIKDRLRYFAEHGIDMHIQIVLIPDYNFLNLENSLNELISLYPAVLSVAVVPIGLTKYRKHLTKLKNITKKQSKETVKLITEIQEKCLNKFGSRIVYASDEFYFTADAQLPDYDTYENFDQLENGVGLAAQFLYEFEKKKKYYSKRFDTSKKILVITGKITENFFRDLAYRLNNDYKTNLIVRAVENKYFGRTVTVSGLISGGDLYNELIKLKSLKEIDDKTLILAPDNLLRYNRDLFIDDMPAEKILNEFNFKFVEPAASAFLKNLV